SSAAPKPSSRRRRRKRRWLVVTSRYGRTIATAKSPSQPGPARKERARLGGDGLGQRTRAKLRPRWRSIRLRAVRRDRKLVDIGWEGDWPPARSWRGRGRVRVA